MKETLETDWTCRDCRCIHRAPDGACQNCGARDAERIPKKRSTSIEETIARYVAIHPIQDVPIVGSPAYTASYRVSAGWSLLIGGAMAAVLALAIWLFWPHEAHVSGGSLTQQVAR